MYKLPTGWNFYTFTGDFQIPEMQLFFLCILEGPSQCLTFLGIEVDTAALQPRLAEVKLIMLEEKGVTF